MNMTNKSINKKDIQYYNIKYKTRSSLFNFLGLNKRKNSFPIKVNHIIEIKNNLLILKKQIDNAQRFNNFFYKIKTYKNKRNLESLPSRGQRTRTNAKTKKKNFLKSQHRVRKNFKVSTTFLTKNVFLFNQIPLDKINIRLTQNNVFCTLTNKTKTEFITSSGIEKIKTSRKTLNFALKIILNSFFFKIKERIKKSKRFFINIVGTIRAKINMLKLIKKNFKSKVLFIHMEHKKCFNGCKPPKKKRKKQKGLRIFK